MAKRSVDGQIVNSASGFVHKVSPLKTSANNVMYFDCVLQTDTSKFRRMVSFDKEKHATLVQASNVKSPVTLTNTREVPSRRDSTETEILVNNKSNLQAAKGLTFKFATMPEEKERIMKISDIEKVPPKNQVIHWCMLSVSIKLITVGLQVFHDILVIWASKTE